MKYLILLLFPSLCFAKEFHFTYVMIERGIMQKLEYKTEASTWSAAHDRGADFCEEFFNDGYAFVSEERMLKVIDTCSNPSEKN